MIRTPPSCFTNFETNANAPFRLFTLPFAGGGSAIYRQWGKHLPGVEVMAARLPGREVRIGERTPVMMNNLIDALIPAITPLLDRPYAIFGHSLGGLVSFELAHRLRELGLREPSCLLVSAYRSPERVSTRPILHRLSEREFLRELADYGGIPEQVLNSPEILQLVMPTLRADFSLFETYRYQARAPLNYPIAAFYGLRDHVVPPAEMAAWADKTDAGFTLQEIDGEHFFVTSQEAMLLEYIATALQPYCVGQVLA